MSIEAIAAVLEHSDSAKTARNVLIALADRADKEGLCFPAVADIQERANARSRRTVQYALKELKQLGELIVVAGAEGGGTRPPLYWIKLPGLDGQMGEGHRYARRYGEVPGRADRGANIAPPDENRGAISDIEGRKNLHGGAQKVTDRGARNCALNRQEPSGTKEERSPAPARETPTVDGRPVTDEEHATAGILIRAFSAEAQDRFTYEGWADKVIRCLRAHPDLTQTDHLAILATSFKNRWWEKSSNRPPTPGVIYATVAQFEGQLAEWRGSKNAPAQQSYDHVIQEVAA